MILSGDDLDEITALKSFLDNQFKIKDLGTLNYFLGIEVAYSPTGLLLHHRKFIRDLLLEYKCDIVSPVVCPLDLFVKLQVDMGDPLSSPESYRSLVGKLNFLTHTRPDLSFVVQHLSQYLQKLTHFHLQAALHLLRYLKGSPDVGVFFNSSSDLSLTAFCDSDWAACPDTRRSVTGFCVILGGSLISWKAKKQPVVSLSSAEAEYRSISKVMAELVWLVIHLLILALLCPFEFLLSVTIKVQSILLVTPSSMSGPSTSRWIVTSFGPSLEMV
ncbi:uncharacterized mitochondrial protein AtMg00810-like [Lycium barbarum]|uniref:uncharacterized mitochondrial protein AtMg00810-like n=1 Tax=Lycium barbarum TaxID=112863 RepID=UPI00293F5D53|nr:uncharacterized mitochondrial protein AtMg00810-like [Lycium barbarum]